MNNIVIGLLAIIGTLIVYLFMWKLHRRILLPVTLPIFLGSIVIVLILLIFHIDYDTYMIGGEWINQLLGPAVVALAYPLYQQRDLLKRLFFPILMGTFVGAVVGIMSGVLLAKWLGVEEFIIYSLVSKSVTTPVSIVIADSLGGAMPLAAVFVMLAGMCGVLIAPFIFKAFKIDHVIGRGVGIGSASHAIGTAREMEDGPLGGSASTVAMVLSAIIVSIIAPILVEWMI
ncbi:hypothetical protein CHI07_20550 [Paenibacillus sp. 7884-2]|nr:hypothetical protein CHI07_20550 [Paenibacillus sp. 7884-2]